MTKVGSKYFRYYLVEATNDIKNDMYEYSKYCTKKFGKVTTQQYKRKLVHIFGKLIHLVFYLLNKNQTYASFN